MAEFWPHAPAQIRETLSFYTDVRSHPAGEIRDSLRLATQRLLLSFRRDPAEGARAMHLFRSNAGGEWRVPLWHDATFHAGAIAAGATSLSVTTEADYQSGGLAVIWKSDTEWELVTVASASGGTLTIGGSPAEVLASYSAPVIVAPVGTFLAPGGMSQAREFALERFSIEFLRTDGTDLGNSTLPAYLSSPVVSEASVVVQPLDARIQQSLDLIDSQFGSYALETEETYVRLRSMLSFADSEVTARWARRRLLHYLRGRDRAFWLPSFRRDFTVVAAFSTTLLQAAEGEFPDVAGLVGRSIEIDTGAALIHRQISAAEVVSGVLRLTLNATPGVTVPTTARVSLMTLQRLDSDQVDIEHQFLGAGFLSQVRVPTIEVAA